LLYSADLDGYISIIDINKKVSPLFWKAHNGKIQKLLIDHIDEYLYSYADDSTLN
jgi:hypothetical protein